MQSRLIYLDYAAATPVADFVLEAMRPYMSERFFNPSSPYAPAVQVRHDYEAAKSRIAGVIGAKGNDIIMTAGATESINLIFNGVDCHVVTSNIEHHAVLEAAKQHDYTLVTANAKGTVAPEAVAAALKPKTTLVSIALANNELGTIQPIKDIAQVVNQERQRRHEAGEDVPLYFHTDASQGAGYLDLHVNRLGVDAMTLNAGKVYGPKQVGLLWAASHIRLHATIKGGGQENGLRSGTENVAGTVGFAEALAASDAHRNAEAKRVQEIRDMMQRRIEEALPDVVVSGNQKKRLPNFLHVSFPGIDAERVVFALEMKGIMVATGSACAANKGTRSHVLTAIGLEPAVADGSLRITLGKFTTLDDANQAVDSIIGIIMGEHERMGK